MRQNQLITGPWLYNIIETDKAIQQQLSLMLLTSQTQNGGFLLKGNVQLTSLLGEAALKTKEMSTAYYAVSY